MIFPVRKMAFYQGTITWVCRRGIAFLALALTVLLAASSAIALEKRPFKIDDMFDLEKMGFYYGGPYDFSPDEQRFAFTRVRPQKTLANHMMHYLWGNAGGDVWVQMSPDSEPVKITDGETDGTGWFAPEWSPDGSKLAMLSTRGGNLLAWVWDAETGSLRKLSNRGINATYSLAAGPFTWLSPTKLLLPVLPEGKIFKGGIVGPDVMLTETLKAQKGREATASVLQSGVPVDLSKRPQGALLLADLETGTTRVLSQRVELFSLSPNRRAIALGSPVSKAAPKADMPLERRPITAMTIHVVTAQGESVVFDEEISRDVMYDSLRWSADGNRLAFLGYAASRKEPPVVYTLDVQKRTVTSVAPDGMDVTPFVDQSVELEWTAGGELLVFGPAYDGEGKRPNVTARRDWWLLSGDKAPRVLTAGMKKVPTKLWPAKGRKAFVGTAGGELWKLVPTTGKVQKLTAGLKPAVTGITWPSMSWRDPSAEYGDRDMTYDTVVVASGLREKAVYHAVDLKSGRARLLDKPDAGARLVAYAPRKETAIYHLGNKTGLRVWRQDKKQKSARVLVNANGFLRDIQEGEFRKITYTSLNGDPLTGWLLLPPNHDSSKKYPLLTVVYAGTVYSDNPPASSSVNNNSSFNMQIPAANGYAVLFPSMPLAPFGVADDPMLRLSEGVLPAVEEAIDVGIADPERLFVMGASFGGFSTYGLVTQTRRFHAAVSLAGLANLISNYSLFDARIRYDDYPHENLFQAALTEAAQVRMGNPPWKDLGRYIRNSPISYVDRVETPLMIIQGDMDYVPMQQGEEFFRSLYRQGKRAEFVRYWGEGHGLRSPANIRDMWKRIFDWFEEFSPKQDDGKQNDR